MPGRKLFILLPRLLLALMLCLGAASALAASRNDPINIEADSAELKEDYSVYTGNVRLTQGGMTINGDRLVVRKQGSGNFTLSLSGRPARIYQPPEAAGAEPIQGRANRIEYGSGQEILELHGNAVINRGGEQIAGENIRYNVRARRTLVNNDGATGGRVKITLQPGK